MEQGSAAAVALGCARAELPAHGCCWRWLLAPCSTAVAALRGGQRCRRSLCGASSHGLHIRQHVVKAWQWQVDNSSPRSVTAGGRAMLPILGAVLQHQIWHPSLPPLLLPMPGARRRSADAPSDFLNRVVRFEFPSGGRHPHTVWKLLRRRVQ